LLFFSKKYKYFHFKKGERISFFAQRIKSGKEKKGQAKKRAEKSGISTKKPRRICGAATLYALLFFSICAWLYHFL
jgi:hypothetical protein